MSEAASEAKWPAMKFGDFAENIAVRIDPAKAETDVYVGLEHLDPSTIHLREWGHPSAVSGQKLCFQKGDVIFGRRRAYQRKLAIAECDGICSAHAMVVRAKPKMILPEFLPFFLQSDLFMDRAIEISVGSLSPTINWKTLKVQEFPLPPIDEQKRMAEILWAADEAGEKYFNLIRDIGFAQNRMATELIPVRSISVFTGGLRKTIGKHYEITQGFELYETHSGNGEPDNFLESGDTLFLKVADFNINSDHRSISVSELKFSRNDCPRVNIFPPGTVVFPKRGASIYLNKVGVLKYPSALDPNLMALVPKEGVCISMYLYWLVKILRLYSICETTSLPQLNHKHLNPLWLPIPSLGEQNRIVQRIEAFDKPLIVAKSSMQCRSDLLDSYTKYALWG